MMSSSNNNRSYTVVNFSDGLYVVPKKWILGKDVYAFPNYRKDSQIRKAVKDYEDAENNWLQYEIIKTYGTYGKISSHKFINNTLQNY